MRLIPLWGVFFFSIPFFHYGIPFFGFRLNFSLFLIILLLILCNFTKREIVDFQFKVPMLKIIYLLYTWMFFGMFYTSDVQRGISGIISITACIIIFITIVNYLDYKYLPRLLKISMFSYSLYIIYVSYVYLIKFNERYISVNLSFPTEANKNTLALFILFIVPYSFYYIIRNFKLKKFKNIILLLSALVIIFGLILTESRAAIIVTIVSILINILIKKSKSKLSIFINLTLASCLIFFISSSFNLDNMKVVIQQDNSYFARFSLVKESLTIFYNNSFIGVGTGGYIDSNTTSSLISHNDFLLYLVENGIIGFTLFISILMYIIYISFKVVKYNTKMWWIEGAATSAIINCLYLFFINAFSNYIIWVSFAIITLIYLQLKITEGDNNDSRSLL